MSIEKMRQPNSFDNKYFNDDYIRKIFASDDRDEINKIQQIHNLTDEQIEIFTYYAKMRKEVIDPMENEIHKRKSENSLATKDEIMIGCYMEDIEPQVREAVVEMNKKGYATVYSGFHSFNSQIIKFKTEQKINISLEQIKKEYGEKGIIIETDEEFITIKFSKKISLEEIKKFGMKLLKHFPTWEGRLKQKVLLGKIFLKYRN